MDMQLVPSQLAALDPWLQSGVVASHRKRGIRAGKTLQLETK